MLASVGRYAPAVIAGSALTGFGFAFGRDVYKKAKDKQWQGVLILLLCLIGVFFAGIWLFRNYRTFGGTVIKKLGALIVLVVSCVGINLASVLVLVLFFPSAVPSTSPTENSHFFSEFLDPPLLWIVIVQAICFLSGAIIGLRHRRKRAQAWRAEAHNEKFLAEHGLQVTDTDEDGNMRIRDTRSNTGYMMQENLSMSRELEFAGLSRSDYAYIQYDETGKFLSWSGPVEPR